MTVRPNPSILTCLVVLASTFACPASPHRGGPSSSSVVSRDAAGDVGVWTGTSVPSVAAVQGAAGLSAHVSGDAHPAEREAVAPDAALPSDARAAAGGQGLESLEVEEAERDPRSETVTIKVLVDPPQRVHVFWGVKDLGVAPLEIKRPRGSGPLDLVLRCPGNLTVHTRAFTDRDDRVAIRMVPETEAARVFGYRREPPKPKVPATTNGRR